MLIQASGSPDFSLTLSNEKPAINSQFDVVIHADNAADLYAYEINLTYDSSRLQFIGYTAGKGGFNINPVLKQDGVQLAHTEIGSKAGLTGNVILATVTFKALHPGSTPIGLSSLQLGTSKEEWTAINSSASVKAIVTGTEGGGQNGQGSHSGHSGGGGAIGVGQGSQADGNEPYSKAGVITPAAKLDQATQTITAAVDSDTLKQAQEQAAESGKGIKKVRIEVEKHPDASDYVLTLPSGPLANSTKTAEIEVNTGLAALTLPNNMLHNGNIPSEVVGLRIAQVHPESLQTETRSKVGAHPVLELSLQSGDRTIPWSNAQAPISVSIPYTPSSEELQHPEHIVVWYVDGSGAIHAVPSGKYDPVTGNVTFRTTHFSTFAIAYLNKSFSDLQSTEWARHSIEVMASKGIVNGISDAEFQPAQPITRADFLVLLVRTLELNGAPGAAFEDVPEQAYYNEPLRIARGLGITDGAGSNRFDPLAPVTREEMMVLTARALSAANQMLPAVNKSVLESFHDADAISSYAEEGVASLVNAGLVQGYDQAIHPKATTTRAETVVLMYSIYNR